MWAPATTGTDLEPAEQRKIDFFADRVLPDRGSGRASTSAAAGGTLRRPPRLTGHRRHRADAEPGATRLPHRASGTRCRHPAGGLGRPRPGGAVTHDLPVRRVLGLRPGPDHGARADRDLPPVLPPRMEWRLPGGERSRRSPRRCADTDAPLGRGPLGDFVPSLYPESICPHLGEIVLGFEPFFEVEVVGPDPADFARTCRRVPPRRATTSTRRRPSSANAGACSSAVIRRIGRSSSGCEPSTNYRLILHR